MIAGLLKSLFGGAGTRRSNGDDEASAHAVLVVTPVFTNPPTQGNAARVLALGSELKAAGLAVDLVHYGLDAFTPDILARMDHEWRSVRHIPKQGHARQAFPAFWGLDDWCPETVCEAVAEACRSTRYAAVIVNYVWMSRCLERVRGPLKIIDTHDLFSDRREISLAAGMEPGWFFTSREEEVRGFARADIVIGIQSAETARIASMIPAGTRTETMTVGHPVAPHAPGMADDAIRWARFGYLGSDNPWNVRSLQVLDRAILDRGLEIDWAAAGGVTRSVGPLASASAVLGAVADPADFYRQVDCVLNPMVAGTGLKIKTVEALAFGRPVIGTVAAFEGLATFHPFQALETVADVAEAASAFSESASIREALGAASLRTFARYASDTQHQVSELCNRLYAAASV